jgi:serine phosphatase RsbU (regulator of sigma subunit)
MKLVSYLTNQLNQILFRKEEPIEMDNSTIRKARLVSIMALVLLSIFTFFFFYILLMLIIKNDPLIKHTEFNAFNLIILIIANFLLILVQIFAFFQNIKMRFSFARALVIFPLTIYLIFFSLANLIGPEYFASIIYYHILLISGILLYDKLWTHITFLFITIFLSLIPQYIFNIIDIGFSNYISFIFVLVTTFLILRFFKVEQLNDIKLIEVKNNNLAENLENIKNQNEEILVQRDQLRKMQDKIEAKNKLLKKSNTRLSKILQDQTRSIEVAKSVQSSILPTHKQIASVFDEHFIFYVPKDIVSGDFYWMRKDSKKVIFIAGDCTGHGVPGAIMSVLVASYIEEITNIYHNWDPSVILDLLRKKVCQNFYRPGEDFRDKVLAGIDISVCIFNFETFQISYAGAFNPVFRIRNSTLTFLEPDKIAIDSIDCPSPTFQKKSFDLQKGDLFYFLSDGFADQFGGPNNKKYMQKKLREDILRFSDKSLSIQKELFQEVFYYWKGDIAQIDDVMLIGLKV